MAILEEPIIDAEVFYKEVKELLKEKKAKSTKKNLNKSKS